MIRSFLTILIIALSLLVVDIVFPGVRLANFPVALLAGAVIGIINAGIKPILSILSLPLTILTLGGFSLVVNGLCFWLAALIVPGFVVNGILAFIAAPILLSTVNTLLSKYFAERLPDITQE